MIRGGAKSQEGRQAGKQAGKISEAAQRTEKSRQSSGLSGHNCFREANRNWGESRQVAKHPGWDTEVRE